MQIILSGTKNAAEVCGIEKDIGTLEKGKIADVIVVEGDPLADLKNMKNVKVIIRSGKIIQKNL